MSSGHMRTIPSSAKPAPQGRPAKSPGPVVVSCRYGAVTSMELRRAGVLKPPNAPRFFTQREQVGLTHRFPVARNRIEPPLFQKRLESQPAAPETLSEQDPALIRDAAVAARPSFGSFPGESLRPAALCLVQPSLKLRRQGFPHLPVRAISVYKSSIRHSIYYLTAERPRTHTTIQERGRFGPETQIK